MIQFEEARVQRLPGEFAKSLDQGLAGHRGNPEAPTVDRIADQGIANMAHVHADLVGTPGLQLDPGMGVRTEAFQHAVMADRHLAGVDHRHLLPLHAMPSDRRIDGAAGGDHADHDRLVDAADRPCLQLRHQLGVGLQRLGHYHQAGRVLVQAVDDPGARHIGDVRDMVEQGIQQGAVLMAGSRMDHQAGGLVNHQDVLVLVDDFQLDVLCEPLALGFLLGLQDQLRAAVDDVARAQHGAVDGQATVLDPAGQTGAGVFGKKLGGDLVETLATQLERHLGRALNHIGHE